MPRNPIRAAVVAAGFVLPAASVSPAAEAVGDTALDPRAAFEQMKSLVGQWKGHATTPDGSEAAVSYELTGNGSALVEKLFPGTSHEMLSVYFMDGKDLVLTHYCAMANQPRMKLVKTSTDPTALSFDFVGGTNIDPAKDTHIHSGQVRILAKDRIEADWAVHAQGKPAGSNKVFLSRK